LVTQDLLNCSAFEVQGDKLILNVSTEKKVFAVIEINSYTGNLTHREENNRLSGIGAMAASIVHDLKNPIGVIIGYADMASDDSHPSPERKEYLQIISDEATRMSAMAHEVLEFSRGELNLALIEVNARDYINDVSRTLSPLFTLKGMEYVSNIEYVDSILIDADRMRRVLLNLASNSKDAMLPNPSGGLFTLSVRLVNNNIQFSATDNGPGIPEQIQATLFEPFVTHGKTHGTGLGMLLSKK